MSNMPSTSMKRRLNVIVALILAAFTVSIVVNLFKVSIVKSADYQALANKQQFRSRTINANRGSITDINGNILAQSATVYNVYIDPVMLKKYDIAKKDLIINSLSEILGMEKDKISSYAEKSSQYEIIERKIEKPIADKIIKLISDNNLSCLGCDPDTKRYYPQNDIAASVIGFTGYEGHGQYGLEALYDEYLSGVDGKIVSAKDAQGQEMPYKYEQSFSAQDGDTLVLNIDSVLQNYLERELKNAVTTHAARNRGCGIIMNVKTGQILAMATEPDFDLNNPTAITDPTVAAYLETLKGNDAEYQKQRAIAWDKQWKNKAITELYFPGSVFKVITGSSALEEKKISLTDTFNCGKMINVSGTIFHCWSNKDHGIQNLQEAMTHSCNPVFVQIGQRLGADLFCKYFNAYGLNAKTGIDLPGEATSLYQGINGMGPVELASSSFGQTNKVTPLEMITAYAAVVNGGNLVTPYVVNKIVDTNGNIVKQFEPQIKRQVISEQTSAEMRKILENVVITNGGSNAYIPGYRIGGKSGTSQKIDENRITGRDDYVSSYVGFAPANDPEIIMLVMVDEPTAGQYYGSAVSAPVVSSVFKEALPYLGYFPEYTDEEYAKMAVTVPNVKGQPLNNASVTFSNMSITVRPVGNGTTIVKQVPSAGSTMPRNGTIYLYTEDVAETMVQVPNVINMSLQDANVAITNAGLNFKPVGGAINHAGAKAIQQNISNQKVPKGEVIEVTFLANDETG